MRESSEETCRGLGRALNIAMDEGTTRQANTRCKIWKEHTTTSRVCVAYRHPSNTYLMYCVEVDEPAVLILMPFFLDPPSSVNVNVNNNAISLEESSFHSPHGLMALILTVSR